MKIEGTAEEFARLLMPEPVELETLRRDDPADLAAAALDAEIEKVTHTRKRMHYKQARAIVMLALRGAE